MQQPPIRERGGNQLIRHTIMNPAPTRSRCVAFSMIILQSWFFYGNTAFNRKGLAAQGRQERYGSFFPRKSGRFGEGAAAVLQPPTPSAAPIRCGRRHAHAVGSKLTPTREAALARSSSLVASGTPRRMASSR
jgi:hypothetical protein